MSQMWNPALETLPREALERRQLRAFREQVAHAYEHSPFYREKLDRAGIAPGDVTSFADVARIPTTTKEELRRAQAAGEGTYGDLLAVDRERVTAYHQTSGTTGTPIRQADSWHDWEWWSDTWATVLWAQGIRPDDRVFLPFSYGAFVAFWAAHYACERIGAEVIPGGNLSSEERVRTMDQRDATAFMTTPTYALRLGEAAEEAGIDPARTAVERIVCAGEPGASVPGTKDRLESVWDATVHDHAGATETGAWGFSCGADSLGLHFNEARFLVEVVDPDGEPVSPGEEGELVVTPLSRRAQPVLRFEQRDRVRLASHEACACGRTFRFAEGGILGRADDFTTVNGVLLSPTAIEDVVRRFEHVTDEYEVVIASHEEKHLDVVTLIVERDPETSLDDDAIESRLRRELKRASKLTFRIELRESGSLERSELKADRLTDNRANA